MKKLTLIFIGLFLTIVLSAQTLTDWTNENPGNITLTQETTEVNEGSSALGVTSTTQDQASTEVVSASFSVTPDAAFTATVDVYDNDIAGRVRICVSFDGSNEYGGYSSDGDTWETIEHTGTVPTGVSTAQVFFRFYDISNDWDGDFECILDNATYTEGGGSNLLTNGGFENWETLTPTAYTIPEIQDTTGNGGGNGSAVESEYVETSGIVTAVFDSDYVIQDGTGEWTGVWVAGSGVARGDSVTVTGTVSESSNLTTILQDNVVVNNSGNTLPAAEILPTGDCGQEAWEGVLLETTGTCTNDTVENNFGEFPIDDGSGEILVDDYGLTNMYYPTQGFNYTVTSPLTFNYGAFKIAVREEADIVEDVGTEPYLAITSPSNGDVIYTDAVDVDFTVYNFVLGTDGKLAYFIDGGTVSYQNTTDPISFTGLSEAEHTVELELVDMSDDPLSPAVSTSVTFTVDLSPGPSITSIYDIQGQVATSPLVGQDVTTTGIVTALNGDNFWMQDAPGEWNGIYVYYAQSGGPARGDSVTVTGTVTEYEGLTELGTITDMTIVSSGNTPYAAVQINTGDASSEEYESVLVEVQGVNNNPPDGYNEWDVNDGTGAAMVDDLLFEYTPTQGNEYRVTGIGEYYYNYKILPRDAADVEDLGASTDPAVIINSPENGDVIYTDAVDVDFTVYNFVLGTDGKLAYFIDGGTVSYQNTTDPISFTGLSEAEHTVELELVDMSDDPLSPAVSTSVTFTVDLTPEITPIYDIQYSTGGNSPLNGDVVTVKGVVAANFNSSTYGEGYYLQDGEGAWNGLYIFDDTNSPDMGDSVRVTGTVNESYNMTQLESIENFLVVDIGGTISGPTLVTIPEANTEPYESVLVRVENVECVTEENQYGEWQVAIGTDILNMKDNGAFSFTPTLNEFYNINGMMYYSYGEYRMHYRIESDIEVVGNVNDDLVADINVYPNPATDYITIENVENVNRIDVVNLTGQIIDSYNVSENTMQMDVSGYSNGVYFVKFILKDNSTGTIRIEKL
ncbi:MAG: T9SS type A sorting domain-containing protein [Bacteroidota bacterium]|nr:T9SS type A sorting domain-containing protein [Bacteroidota bacterium]